MEPMVDAVILAAGLGTRISEEASFGPSSDRDLRQANSVAIPQVMLVDPVKRP